MLAEAAWLSASKLGGKRSTRYWAFVSPQVLRRSPPQHSEERVRGDHRGRQSESTRRESGWR